MNTSKKSPISPGRFLILGLFALAPLELGAKGCDRGVVGNEECRSSDCPGPTEPGDTCGGIAGLPCGDNQFCDFPAGAMCGAADRTGACRAIPEACGEIYSPVCGCDDRTYENPCSANAAGVSVARTGPCESSGGTECGGITGLSCGEGEFCNFEPSAQCGAADQTGSCEPLPEACDLIYQPVCGCDDQTYGNECAAHMAGVSVASRAPCEGPAGGGDCGGLLGLACDAGEFCDFAPSAQCGAADQTGTCRAIPEVCADIYAPVCGCDDQTYGNECEANAAGVSVASQGPCGGSIPPKGTPCGGLEGLSCPDLQFCNYPIEALCGAADATGTCTDIPGACTREYAPVCGCDGNTYGNACDAASNGVSVQAVGECP